MNRLSWGDKDLSSERIGDSVAGVLEILEQSHQEAIDFLEARLYGIEDKNSDQAVRLQAEIDESQKILDAIESVSINDFATEEVKKRNLYEVELVPGKKSGEEIWLDWDKPFYQQNEYVQKVLMENREQLGLAVIDDFASQIFERLEKIPGLERETGDPGGNQNIAGKDVCQGKSRRAGR
jgi:predicted helicase